MFPEPVTEPVQILVMSYDATGSKYRLIIGELTTLTNLRTMEGDAAQILGGAEIVVDYDELVKKNPQTIEETQAITEKKAGRPVDFAYFEVNGIIHPEEFHSLNIATTYYNFEKSHLYFAGLGAALYHLPVLYFPEMSEGPASDLVVLRDNAIWDPIGRRFAVLPFEDIQELPMGMNLGIVAHEFSHAVFSNRVFPQGGVPWIYEESFKDPQKWSRPMNISRSLNEGLADFFGAMVSGDPKFISKSLSIINDERRLDPEAPRCMSRDMEDAYQLLPDSQYNPYPLGSVLATTLWETIQDLPERRNAFARGLIDALTDIGVLLREKEDRLQLADVLDAVASTFAADLKPRGCGLLADRFGLSPAQLPSCAELQPPARRCK